MDGRRVGHTSRNSEALRVPLSSVSAWKNKSWTVDSNGCVEKWGARAARHEHNRDTEHRNTRKRRAERNHVCYAAGRRAQAYLAVVNVFLQLVGDDLDCLLLGNVLCIR
jgi:hypothetical protein